MSDHTREAVHVLRRAVESERDFPGWLANVLATVADDCEDGSYTLIAGRPGSWEATHVSELAEGGVVLHDNE
ncbi:hypothetical protein [Planotetraspora sp. GP83]|uniref:hypothetical protein n=1 Tax=Planotetraspora sp. GP83 TaxID=3156264 RepID=UPI003512A1D9